MSVYQDKHLKKYIGNKLREIREKHGLTQSDVAKKARVETNYYAIIERGDKSMVSLPVLKKIIKALGVTSSDILDF